MASTKTKFTLQDLFNLMVKSATVKAMNPVDVYGVLRNITEATSPQAQALYAILLDEQDSYKRIEKDFVRNIGNVMQTLKNEILDIKKQGKTGVRQKKADEVKRKEERAAEAIVKKISQ